MWYSFCGHHGAILMSYVCGVECHFIPRLAAFRGFFRQHQFFAGFETGYIGMNTISSSHFVKPSHLKPTGKETGGS